jgi:hypothetical protein
MRNRFCLDMALPRGWQEDDEFWDNFIGFESTWVMTAAAHKAVGELQRMGETVTPLNKADVNVLIAWLHTFPAFDDPESGAAIRVIKYKPETLTRRGIA